MKIEINQVIELTFRTSRFDFPRISSGTDWP
jgi:hypothetical protein